eukprot:14108766-Alexandrium_andersonii.AAC.1
MLACMLAPRLPPHRSSDVDADAGPLPCVSSLLWHVTCVPSLQCGGWACRALAEAQGQARLGLGRWHDGREFAVLWQGRQSWQHRCGLGLGRLDRQSHLG